jgi:hypothetical protein
VSNPFSEIANPQSDLGALEKSPEAPGRPFSVLDRSFFKDGPARAEENKALSEGLTDVGKQSAESPSRPFSELDKPFFRGEPTETPAEFRCPATR